MLLYDSTIKAEGQLTIYNGIDIITTCEGELVYELS